MKSRNLILGTAIAGVVTFAASGNLFSDDMSKPGGAMGSGSAAENQPKSNQFW